MNSSSNSQDTTKDTSNGNSTNNSEGNSKEIISRNSETYLGRDVGDLSTWWSSGHKAYFGWDYYTDRDDSLELSGSQNLFPLKFLQQYVSIS